MLAIASAIANILNGYFRETNSSTSGLNKKLLDAKSGSFNGSQNLAEGAGFETENDKNPYRSENVELTLSQDSQISQDSHTFRRILAQILAHFYSEDALHIGWDLK